MSENVSNEVILPAFFGQDCELYGCFHLAADYLNAPTVLVCQPTVHEYDRCHRAMRQLAVQSAKKGLSTLRFDYYATGNSSGESEELSLSRMRQDVEQAIRHCRDKTGVDKLTLVGLRLGATLAAQVACHSSEVEALILYAPVFDGEQLLLDWQREQQAFDDKHSYATAQSEGDEILGFPLSPGFRKELTQKFPPENSPSALKRVLVLVDEGEADSGLLRQWVSGFEQRGVEVVVEETGEIAIWRREPMDAIVPVKTIRRMVKWLAEAHHG